MVARCPVAIRKIEIAGNFNLIPRLSTTSV